MIRAVAEQVQADSVLDLGAYLIVGIPGMIGAIVAAIIAIRSIRTARGNAEHIEAIRESVVNDHPRPMRYDLDDLAAAIIAVRGDVAKVSAKVDENRALTVTIGQEVREDRKARRDGDKDLDKRLQDLDQKVNGAVAEARAVVAKHPPEDAS